MLRKYLLLALGFVISFQSLHAEELSQFKVAAILPLSGSSASLGNYIKNGIELAYSQLPQDERARIMLVFEDDGWQVSRSLSAFHSLLQRGAPNAVIVVGSAVGNALAPLAEEKGIPLISVGASDSKVSSGRRFAFIHWVTPETEARVLVEEMRRRDYKRIATIGSQQEGVLAVLKHISAELARVGLSQRTVLEQFFLPTETDFRTYISKARSLNVDGVVVCLLPGSLAAFAKQSRQHGLSADLIGVELFEDESEVNASGKSLVGQWYVNADSADSSFERSYQKRFGHHPGWAAANAFDSFQLLAQAHRNHGPAGDSIANFLHNIRDYSGAAGRYSATGDGRFTLSAAVKVVTATGFEKLPAPSAG